MDLKDPATLASISNSIILSPVQRTLKTLHKGEPMALGITQILIGILVISFGLMLVIVESSPTFRDVEGHILIPYWMGILYIISGSFSVAATEHPKVPLYIISGSLSVAATKDPKVPLVKGMLAMNVVSSMAAGTAIVLLCVSLYHPRFYYGCHSYDHRDVPPDICQEYVTVPHNLMYATTAFLLAVTVLEFLISITSAAFGCATVCKVSYSETTVVIFQNTAAGIIPASALPGQMNEAVEA